MELRDEVLERGEQTSIARYLQQDPSKISRQLDPHNEDCPSVVYQTLQWLWALDCLGRRRGDALLELIIREREKWLVNCPNPQKDARQLTSTIFEKVTEFLKTELNEADLDTVLNRLGDVRKAVEDKADQVKAVRLLKTGINPDR